MSNQDIEALANLLNKQKPTLYYCEQRSDEWYSLRQGKMTASRIADALAKTKTGWGVGRERYAVELALERITGQSAPNFVSADMQWGIDTEDEAIQAYEYMTGNAVDDVGFVENTAAPIGCSPDGLVGLDGSIEVKCPATHTHVQTVLSGKVKSEYVQQMEAQMIICKRNWCDFISYDPRTPPGLSLFVKRHFLPSTAEMNAKLIDYAGFLLEVDALETKLRAKINASG